MASLSLRMLRSLRKELRFSSTSRRRANHPPLERRRETKAQETLEKKLVMPESRRASFFGCRE
jgi:hypothetical protein